MEGGGVQGRRGKGWWVAVQAAVGLLTSISPPRVTEHGVLITKRSKEGDQATWLTDLSAIRDQNKFNYCVDCLKTTCRILTVYAVITRGWNLYSQCS